MAGIVEIIYRNYIWQYKRILLILFLCILFTIAGFYAYKWYAKSIIEKKPYDDVANANKRQKTADILFFHTGWCPHCVKALPAWVQFTENYNGTVVNGYTINCIDVDCTEGDNHIGNANLTADNYIQKYNIEHYPTVKMVFNGEVIDFEANISESSLSQFVKTIIK